MKRSQLPKKIIKLLDANPQNETERMSLDQLRRYIRSLDGQAVYESILVTFSMLEGAGRRPIIRTCGPIIELPSIYHSYSELEKRAWSFNIA